MLRTRWWSLVIFSVPPVARTTSSLVCRSGTPTGSASRTATTRKTPRATRTRRIAGAGARRRVRPRSPRKPPGRSAVDRRTRRCGRCCTSGGVRRRPAHRRRTFSSGVGCRRTGPPRSAAVRPPSPAPSTPRADTPTAGSRTPGPAGILRVCVCPARLRADQRPPPRCRLCVLGGRRPDGRDAD